MRKRHQYILMKGMVTKMALQKYYDSLRKKGLDSLRKNRIKRLEMRAVVLGYEVGFCKMRLKKAFNALRNHIAKSKSKKMQLNYIDRLHTSNTMEKCFTNWLYFARR